MRLVSYAPVLLVAGTALALASCSRDRPTAPTFDTDTGSHRLSTQSADSILFGPATYTRDAGEPRTDSASFAARAGDTLSIVITAPVAQGLNATVELNGRRVYASADDGVPSDDHRGDDDHGADDDHHGDGAGDGHGHADEDGRRSHAIRAVARATNTLRIAMTGKPGSALRIVVSVLGAPRPAERRVLTTIYGGSVTGSLPLGAVEYPLGATVRYRFRPRPGFVRMRVVVDGRLASVEGTLRMDRAHWIAASADTVMTLDGTERALSRSLRSLLSSANVREDWVAYQAAIERAASAWGAEADRHLARIELATIDPAADLARLMRLDAALAGMVTSVDPLGGVSAPLRSASRTSSGARALRNAASETEVGAREPTQIMLVNGMLNGEPSFRAHGNQFLALLTGDAGHRFPRDAVGFTSIYNPSFATMDSLSALARVCERIAALAADVGPTPQLPVYAASYLGCLADQVTTQNDFAEMFSWARSAVGHVDPNSAEVNRLATVIWSTLVDSTRHVLIVGHSEGSLMMQLAVQKLRAQAHFNEDSATRCIGTVSVAGVGTANWPLTERHARFVVAQGDLVTLLSGDLRNTRQPIEDDDTRANAAVYARLAAETSHLETLVPWGTKSSIEIHALKRYLQTDGSRIADDLDALYRTCAVGAVDITPSAATVQLHGAYAFKARWTALDRLPLTTTDSVRWSVDSALAHVSSIGRLLAGGSAGTATLQARVRNTIGFATVTISDDSAQSSHAPPAVSVTERTGVLGPFPPGPTVCDVQFMTVAATAAAGASITAVELYTRVTAADTVYYGHGPAPIGEEFQWRMSNCTVGGAPVANATDNWYRLVVTDSRGAITELIGPRP